jgi:hypothetical protein
MDVHIDQVEADITPPSPSAGQAPRPAGGQPAQTPEAAALRLREHIQHIGQRRDRLRAD